ncbi:WAP four-disulfide core domain protein 3-like [Boleophthalmus pectinirostris]|uniref:WAP four-disulfide core domain protein 3-like n=1 Tax=Boleophthalmus pectinirostris TaxID=150288 RepID=UPI00242B7258|nr:WAP four-disulfide core domain protein 3-like [Boleophthalmus pectinirostris]
MKFSVLCLLTVAFVPLLSALKDEHCPESVLNGPLFPCQEQCSRDRDCERNMKCCYTGSWAPVLRPTWRSSAPETGTVKRNMKCCYTGCGHLCYDPRGVSTDVPKPKPGSCPKPYRFDKCIQKCDTDRDCEGKLKCCFNGCGFECMDPVHGNH